MGAMPEYPKSAWVELQKHLNDALIDARIDELQRLLPKSDKLTSADIVARIAELQREKAAFPPAS